MQGGVRFIRGVWVSVEICLDFALLFWFPTMCSRASVNASKGSPPRSFDAAGHGALAHEEHHLSDGCTCMEVAGIGAYRNLGAGRTKIERIEQFARDK